MDIDESLRLIAEEKIQQINDYFAHPAKSQSILKSLEYGPEALINQSYELEKKLYYQEKEHFIIGSGVDCKLTLGNIAFDILYHSPKLEKKPSAVIMSITKKLFDNQEEERLGSMYDILDEIIIEVANDESYGATYLRETKLKKIREGGEEYYKALIQGIGKQIVSEEELQIINDITYSLLTNPRTSHYFQAKRQVEIKYQTPIYFEYRGHQCKALLDMLIIDHDNKTFTVVDIKTMSGSTLTFHKSLRQRRYDIQVKFYQLAAQSQYPDYTPLDPVFLVESTTSTGQPLDYQCDKTLLNIALNGANEVFWSGILLAPQILGIEQLIDRLEWYQLNGVDRNYLVPKDKPVSIDWYGITRTN